MVDDPQLALGKWPVEQIPGPDSLFMRIHRNWVINGAPMPGAFRNRDRGMSTNWSKHSTPEETRQQGVKPEENGVIRMQVRQVRSIKSQVVEHTPKPLNRAHTDVAGEKDSEARLKFLRIYDWDISPPAPLSSDSGAQDR